MDEKLCKTNFICFCHYKSIVKIYILASDLMNLKTL